MILFVEAGVGRGYRIGELAAETGLTRDTLRYYERCGLLERPERSPGGFRLYSRPAIDRLRFIQRAKTLGFALDEIRELVRFNGKGGLRRCGRVRDLLRDRVRGLEETLLELNALRETLQTTLAQCEQALEMNDASACPVIELRTDRGKDGADDTPNG